MTRNTITIADQKFIRADKLSWQEAIALKQAEKMAIVSNPFFNRLINARDSRIKHGDIEQLGSWYTGTAFEVSEKGKKIGKTIESVYQDRITVVSRIDAKYRDLINVMLMSDDPQLVDKKGKLITNLNEAPETIFLKSNGKVRTFKIKDRHFGYFEKIDERLTRADICDCSSHGLLLRGIGLSTSMDTHWVVRACARSSHKHTVIFHTSDASDSKTSASK